MFCTLSSVDFPHTSAEIAKCAGIADSAARLRCFDAAALRAEHADDAEQALDGAHGDEDADEREEPGLAERRKVLRLAVAELVLNVRRPRGDAHGEVGEQRRNEVGAGVRGLRDEAEAAGREADAQLEDDERRSCGNGDEC